MSAQNCRIRTARDMDGMVHIVFKNKEINRVCGPQPCKPVPVIGFPAESCAECNRTF